MSGFEEPGPSSGWEAFRAARDRFFAQVRPAAVEGAFVSAPVDPVEAAQPDPAAAARAPVTGHERVAEHGRW